MPEKQGIGMHCILFCGTNNVYQCFGKWVCGILTDQTNECFIAVLAGRAVFERFGRADDFTARSIQCVFDDFGIIRNKTD